MTDKAARERAASFREAIIRIMPRAESNAIGVRKIIALMGEGYYAQVWRALNGIGAKRRESNENGEKWAWWLP